jgi:hypothetical protein
MIVINGVNVSYRSKEELLRKEILSLRNRNSELESLLEEKYKLIDQLMLKIHAMGGRVRKK